VACVYVLDDAAAGPWKQGGAARWWLHHSLAALDGELRARGGRLLLVRGDTVEALVGLAHRLGTRIVHAIGHVEPWHRAQESALARHLDLRLHDGLTLHPLHALRTASGGAFKVFTPFWRTLRQLAPPPLPRPAPGRLATPADLPAGERLDDWRLLPSRPDWTRGFTAFWSPGEAGGQDRLEAFARTAADYAGTRDLPALDGTSRLAPYLHFGNLSPVQVWHGIGEGAEPFLRQLGWRDFSLNLLLHSPTLPDRNWRPAFDAFPWITDAAAFRAWARGQTGYPIVDAGMRQLWQTGWMHNRVRMIAASFLIKHLMLDWREGEAWFWDTLVDADLANNAAGWQWVAGSGADAAPYFRIFNPVAQAERFDPDGAYIRTWVPELAGLPAPYIHAPWTAPPLDLAQAGVILGRTYPPPIVDHGRARARALAAYHSLKTVPAGADDPQDREA